MACLVLFSLIFRHIILLLKVDSVKNFIQLMKMILHSFSWSSQYEIQSILYLWYNKNKFSGKEVTQNLKQWKLTIHFTVTWKKYVCNFIHHFSTLIWYTLMKCQNHSLWNTNKYPLILSILCHGCWWPGKAKDQDIGSHSIDLVSRNILATSQQKLNDLRQNFIWLGILWTFSLQQWYIYIY